MMKRFYEGKEKQLETELESWIGTPYKHWSGIKGRGVDCIHFVVRVIEATGGNQGRSIHIQKYNKDWHLHRGEELLKQGIERQLPVKLISLPLPEKSVSKLFDKSNAVELTEPVGSGDIVLFQFGRHAAHAGIFVNGKVYQTVNDTGVLYKPWESDFFNRVVHVFKLYDVETI